MLNNIKKIKEKQKSYYNKIADIYDNYKSSNCCFKYREFIFDQIFKNIDLSKMKVLDAMCGSGAYSSNLIARGGEVTGIDISNELCGIYRNKFPENQVICGSVLKMPFKDKYFDLVFINSLHHLHPYVNTGVEEVVRVLKPGGYLVIFETSTGSIFDFIRKFWYKMDSKFFEGNEKSIDSQLLENQYKNKLKLIKKTYGGNIAYILVQHALILRIPRWLPGYYYRILLPIEKILMRLQGRLFAMWFLALFQKINDKKIRTL